LVSVNNAGGSLGNISLTVSTIRESAAKFESALLPSRGRGSIIIPERSLFNATTSFNPLMSPIKSLAREVPSVRYENMVYAQERESRSDLSERNTVLKLLKKSGLRNPDETTITEMVTDFINTPPEYRKAAILGNVAAVESLASIRTQVLGLQMKIYVFASSRHIPFILSPGSSIEHLRKVIEETLEISSTEQKLFFGAEEIPQSGLLLDYNIQDQSTIQLIPPQEKKITLYLYHKTEHIPLTFLSFDTIEHLRKVVSERTQIPPERQHLLFGGVLLSSKGSLASCHLVHESTINLSCLFSS